MNRYDVRRQTKDRKRLWLSAAGNGAQSHPLADEALSAAGVSLADLGAVAVATQPGLVGALVVVSADDPGMASSQNEQDNRGCAPRRSRRRSRPSSPRCARSARCSTRTASCSARTTI